MTTTEAYRLYAADCMQLAQTVSDPDRQARLVAIAQKWRELADEAARQSQNSLRRWEAKGNMKRYCLYPSN